ncbi:MAG: hypothetical protein ABL867_00360 [Rickettsiales bacterium]|jgi:hypothetical protein
MPITSTDLKFHLSGGAANSDPNAALGGAISTTQIVDATVANLFDNVSSAESAAGDTEYRCFYVKNTHATLTLQAAKVYIQTNTPSADTSAEIGLGTSAVNGTEQTVANESTAPSAVTFSSAAGSGNALSIGNIPAGQHKAIWLKRIVNAAAAAYNSDSVIIRVEGDTAA